MTQVSAGVFAGYDYQIGRAVVGVEGDYNRVFGSNESHISEDQYPGPGGIWSLKSRWNASIRGRLGFLATDRALVYGTAGVAFSRFDLRGGVENTIDDFYEIYPNFGAGDIGGGTRVGWTAGGGLQYALDANWSMRGEYRYTDYGTKTLTYIPNLPGAVAATTDVKVTENRVSMGMSYKFSDP